MPRAPGPAPFQLRRPCSSLSSCKPSGPALVGGVLPAGSQELRPMANQKSLSSAEQRPLPTWLGLRSSWDSPVRPSQQKYGGRCRPGVQPDLWRIEALGSPRSHVKQCRGRRLQDRQAGQRTRLSGLSSHTFAAARFADFLHLSLSVFPLFCLYSSPRVPSSFLLTTTLLPTRPLRKAFSFEDHASFPSHLSLLNYLYFFFLP